MWIHIDMNICIKVRVFNFSPFSLCCPFLMLLPNVYQPQHIRSLNEIYETWWICKPLKRRMHMFHCFLIWSLIAGLCPFLMIYRIFLPLLLQILWNLIHGFGIRKEVITYFPVFSGRVLGLSYAPLKFSKEKSFLWLLLLNHLMEFLEFKLVNTYVY